MLSFFFFKQKTAYEMRISDWSSDVCSSDLAPSQHELGVKFDTLVRTADNMQIYKYVVHMVAHSYGKTATFMPKPIYGDNGSGMHTHQSIWKGGKKTFAGSLYADLSETCLFYIGGIIQHQTTERRVGKEMVS